MMGRWGNSGRFRVFVAPTMLVALTFCLPSARAGTVGPLTAQWVAGRDWTYDASNLQASAVASDDLYCGYNEVNQDEMVLRDFGFVLPEDALVVGIEVTVEGWGDDKHKVDRSFYAGLTKDGTTASGIVKLGLELPAADGLVTIGAVDDLWGTTWRADQVESANFGVLIADEDTTAAPLYFDQVQVTVHYVFAARRYWVASSSGSWSNTANWATNSGGVGGATAPVGNEIAIFDGGTNGVLDGNCTLDGDVAVIAMRVDSAYDGQILQGNHGVGLGELGGRFSGGTFDGGSGAFGCTGLLHIAGGGFTFTTNNAVLGDGFTFSSGLLSHGSGTILLNGDENQAFNPGAAVLNDVVVSKPSGTVLLGGGLIAAGSFNLTAGVFDAGGHDLTISGDFLNAGSFRAGAGTTTVNGVTGLISMSESHFNVLVVAAGSTYVATDDLMLSDLLWVDGRLEIREELSGLAGMKFQNGVSPSAGYLGTRDTFVNVLEPATNYGALSYCKVDGKRDVGALLWWDVSALPIGTTVRLAEITVHVTKNTQGDSFEAYCVKRNWLEDEVTWTDYALGSPWEVGGCQGSLDRDDVVLGAFASVASGPSVIELNTAGIDVVHGWHAGSDTNHGFTLQDYGNRSRDEGLFYSSEAATPGERPELAVWVTPAELPFAGTGTVAFVGTNTQYIPVLQGGLGYPELVISNTSSGGAYPVGMVSADRVTVCAGGRFLMSTNTFTVHGDLLNDGYWSNDVGSLVFDGATLIQGSGESVYGSALISGTVTLMSGVVASADVVVTGGMLRVDGILTNSSAGVTASGWLEGTGIVDGAVTVNAGSWISANTTNQLGAFAIGDTLLLDGRYLADVPAYGTSDVLLVAGVVSGAGSIDVDLGGFTPMVRTNWVVIRGGAGSDYSGLTNNLTVYGSADPQFRLHVVGTDLELRFIPWYDLVVASTHGSPAPAVGTNVYEDGTMLTCLLPDSPVSDGVLTQYVCTGWGGTGSVPGAGSTTNTGPFSLVQDSTIAWLWGTNYWLDTGAGPNGTVDVADGWCEWGSNVTVGAGPAVGHHFVNWTGPGVPSGSESNNPLNVVMDRSRQVTANFAINVYTIVATAGANGFITPIGAIPIHYGSSTSFVMTAGAHYHILDVDVDGSSVGPVGSHVFLNVVTDRTIHVTFEIDQHDLVVSSPHGTPGPARGTNAYDYGTGVGCDLPDSPVVAGSLTQYVCSGWAGSGSVPDTGVTTNVAVTLTNDSTLAWTWSTNYWLDTESGGNGTVDVADGWRGQGSNVTITAIPSVGYHFSGWIGDVPAGNTNDNPVTIMMVASRIVTATFEIDRHDLVVSSTYGTPVPAVGTNPYDYGTVVPCALPDSPVADGSLTQYVCGGWAGTGSVPAFGATTNVTVTLTNDSSLAWTWTTNYWLDTESGGNGTVDVADGWQGSGASVDISGAPSVGYHFVNWTGAGVPAGTESNNPLSVVMDESRQVTANFAINVYTIMATAGTNGSVVPAGAIAVEHGSDTNFTITADAHYHVLDVQIDGSGIGPTNAYSFVNVVTDRTIHATFELDQHDLVVSSAYGTPSPAAGTNPYDYGTVVPCTLPDSPVADGSLTQYVCGGWAGTGSVPGSGATTNVSVTVTNDSSLAWTWTTNYWLDTESGGNGTVDVADGWQGSGASVDITGAPSVGCHFVNWTGAGVPAGTESNNPLSVVMDESRQVTANFVIDEYTITATAGANGSVAPAGAIPVDHGSATNFTITADAYYHILDVEIDGSGIGATNAYTFVNVVTDRTIHATFDADLATNDVPVWWLVQYGLGTNDPDLELDADGDRSVNWMEYYAGTDPTNGSSTLLIDNVQVDAGSDVVIQWYSVAGKTYDVTATPDLIGSVWTPVTNGIPATAPLNTLSLGPATDTVRAFRVEVVH